MTNPLRIVLARTSARGLLRKLRPTAQLLILGGLAVTTVTTGAEVRVADSTQPFQKVVSPDGNSSGSSPSLAATVEVASTLDVTAAIDNAVTDAVKNAANNTATSNLVGPWPAARLAIVIDDLGYDRRRGLQAIALPGVLTVAVMPHTPNATFLAETAHEAGREIILHQPMQGSDYTVKNSAPRGILTLDMGPADIRYELRKALTSVPHCIGINNHTGSTLTQARSNMYWLMQQVASTDLYYLDSRTTTQTVAGEAAQAWGVPFVSRDVFLDHDNDQESIARQFKYAVKLAKRRGHAILIAHPRPLSLALLAQQLPKLDPTEIELVHASELIGVRGRLDSGRTVAGE